MQVVITDCDHGFVDPERKVIEGAGHSLVVRQCRTAEEVAEAAREADGLMCQSVPITGEILRLLRQCRVVGRYGVGLDNVDVASATRLGIKVVHVPDFCSQEASEHALALILSAARKVGALNHVWKGDPASFQARWRERLCYLRGVQSFNAQTVGVVGLGKIGQGLAKRARAVGFNVVGFDPYVDGQAMDDSLVRRSALEDLLSAADYVSLHVPLTAATRRLIGERELRTMKSTAHLVNTSRGAVVDEAALVRALREGWIAGAALDVSETEPLPLGHPFFQMDQVVLTPHIAFYSDRSIKDVKERTARYVLNALTGEGDYHLANPEVLG